MGNSVSNVIKTIYSDEKLEKTDWANVDETTVKIENKGTGNDLLIFNLKKTQAIVGNIESIVYINNNVKLLPENVVFKSDSVAPSAPVPPPPPPSEPAPPSPPEPEMVQQPPPPPSEPPTEPAPPPEQEIVEPETQIVEETKTEEVMPEKELNEEPKEKEPIRENEVKEIKGGVTKAAMLIKMGTFYAENDNAQVTLCAPYSSSIEQVQINPYESWNIIKSGLLAYTKDLTVTGTQGNINNIFEINKNGIVFTQVKNDSDVAELIWLNGFGTIQYQKIETDSDTFTIPIDKLLAVKYNTPYTIKKEGGEIFITFGGGSEFYTHSKNGLSYYVYSKNYLLETLDEGFTLQVKKIESRPAQEPRGLPASSDEFVAVGGMKIGGKGRKLFKNEKKLIRELEDPNAQYENIMKFIS